MKKQTMTLLCVLAASSTSVHAGTDWLKKGAALLHDVSAAVSDRKEARPPGETFPMRYHTDGRSVDIDYGFFEVNYSCEHRGFNYLNYRTVPDQGSYPRHEPFYDEPGLTRADCPPQKTTRSYKKRAGQAQYHRGHGNHQNIWDHNKDWMVLTNRMTNVVPHNGVQNASGLWRKLEVRVECARDQTTVNVYLGNDWGNDASNDHFVRSHGVTTPDHLWRVHVYDSHPNQAFAWYMANDEKAKIGQESMYRITLAELKAATADDFAWPIPPQWVDAHGADPYQHITCSWK